MKLRTKEVSYHRDLRAVNMTVFSKKYFQLKCAMRGGILGWTIQTTKMEKVLAKISKNAKLAYAKIYIVYVLLSPGS
jgi:hypothetical protein